MILVNRFLREYERAIMNDNLGSNDDDMYTRENSNHLWIPPLAATFVGCISMMFFAFLSSIFLDIITTLFVCFAVDKDNSVDMSGSEFEALAKESINYVECEVETVPSTTSATNPGYNDNLDYSDVEGGNQTTPVAIPVTTY